MQAREVLSFPKNKLLHMCIFMVLVELPVLSFYTSLNGCFGELRNHAPVSINKSCSFEVFIMNDLFPNLVFISCSKDSCTKKWNICAYYHYSNFQCSFARISQSLRENSGTKFSSLIRAGEAFPLPPPPSLPPPSWLRTWQKG